MPSLLQVDRRQRVVSAFGGVGRALRYEARSCWSTLSNIIQKIAYRW